MTDENLEEWDQALGPMSSETPTYSELSVDEDTVRLVGPSIGNITEHDRDEFESLLEEGEWILVKDDPENQQKITPNGTRPY